MSHVYTRPLGPFEARSTDTFFMKTLRWMMRRLTWIIPAAYDVAADDVGDTYQMGLTMIMCLFGGGLGLIIMLAVVGLLTISIALLGSFLFYILYEIPYYLYERSWGMN